jgi:hypothetical protein
LFVDTDKVREYDRGEQAILQGDSEVETSRPKIGFMKRSFHQWTPDVYEGVQIPLFMGPKILSQPFHLFWRGVRKEIFCFWKLIKIAGRLAGKEIARATPT